MAPYEPLVQSLRCARPGLPEEVSAALVLLLFKSKISDPGFALKLLCAALLVVFAGSGGFLLLLFPFLFLFHRQCSPWLHLPRKENSNDSFAVSWGFGHLVCGALGHPQGRAAALGPGAGCGP